jgi:uncharacterized RDD family membrane protein YckC
MGRGMTRPRTFVEFDSPLPYDGIEADDDFVQYPGRTIAEAIVDVLTRLGCETGPIEDLDFKGWEFEFRSGQTGFVCRVTMIYRYFVIFNVTGWPKRLDSPPVVETMAKIEAALAADERFSDPEWFHREEWEGREEAKGAARRAQWQAELTGLDDFPVGWFALPPAPWRRFAARMFDGYAIAGVVLLILVEAIGAPSAWILKGSAFEFLAILILLVAISTLSVMLNAVALHRTSTTPGKWLCGIKVVSLEAARPSYAAAIRREAEATVVGCAAFIFPLSILIARFNWDRLNDQGVMPWDKRQRLVAIHRPSSWLRTVATFLCLYAAVVVFGEVANLAP